MPTHTLRYFEKEIPNSSANSKNGSQRKLTKLNTCNARNREMTKYELAI